MRNLLNTQQISMALGVTVLTIILFQNCARVTMQAVDTPTENSGLTGLGGGPVVVPCDRISCELTPLTNKPAVATILLTLGDRSNSALVIGGASSQLISETLIRSSSPVNNPKILAVIDSVNGDEDVEDIDYLIAVLLSRYQVTVLRTNASGITDDDVKNFDVVWYNNPGHPMSSKRTLKTLLNFKGGVILQGDDLSWGEENGTIFSLQELTGLKFIDNGTEVECNGIAYGHDDNSGNQYRVSIDPAKIQGASSAALNFRYGNDIDRTQVASQSVEVIASALGGPESCVQARPAIVRYLKK